MKNKIILVSTILFFCFCFIILFKGLSNSNIYTPNKLLDKSLVDFQSKDLFSKKEISSDEIFSDHNFYILNIWASWCLPCRDEHALLMQINKNASIKLIGLNYKDNSINAKKFINELGNPYSVIITDLDGTISIELGAYGVPETFIINKNKKIIKKFIGPLDDKLINEINFILK